MTKDNLKNETANDAKVVFPVVRLINEKLDTEN